MQDNPTKELLTALSQFQRTTLAAHKDDSTGRFAYATEKSINDSIRLAKTNGLAHTFTMTPCGVTDADTIGQTEVKLRVFHAESGGFIQSSMLVADYDPKNNRDIRHQQRGAGISYAKRYLLAAAFGIATEDDEGECLAKDIQAEAEAKAQAQAKPKALSNSPTQQQAPAKQETDPFTKRRASISADIKAANEKDKGVYALWAKQIKEKFHVKSTHPITADKPVPDNLICEEHFVFCDKFIADLKILEADMATVKA